MWTRIRIAWRILTGKSKLNTDGIIRCGKAHPEGNQIIVEKKRLKDLERAADDLKVANGVIAGLGKLRDYAEVLKSTLGD
jgi:hypothetical protein